MEKVKVIMLHVEQGEETELEFSDGISLMTAATVIKSFTDNGCIMSDIEIVSE